MLEVLSWRRGQTKRWDWGLIAHWLVVLSPAKVDTIHTHSQEGPLARVEAIFSCLCLQREAPVRVTERPGCYFALLQCGRPAPQQSHPAPNANSKVLRQTYALLKPTIAMSSSDLDSSTSLALRIWPGIWSFVCEPSFPSPWQSHGAGNFHSENLLPTIYLDFFFGAIEYCLPCLVLPCWRWQTGAHNLCCRMP